MAALKRRRAPLGDSSETAHLLFFHPSMRRVAEKLGADYPGQICLGEITWGVFRDGWPELFVSDSKGIPAYSHVTFLASVFDVAELFPQLAVIYCLPRLRARNFKVIIPYFTTGTMERCDEPGQVATAMTLARMLSATPQCATGPTTFSIFDIHALQEQFYFSDAVHIELNSAVHLLRCKIQELTEADGTAFSIAFPDDGAYKRFRKQFPSLPHIICGKIRDGEDRRVTVKEGLEHCAGRHVVIVDDLVQTGGTLLACAQALRQLEPISGRGCVGVSAFVTHAVFPDRSWQKFTVAPRALDHFWVTDTCVARAAELDGVEPFEVLSIAPVVAWTMLGQSCHAHDMQE